MKAFLLLACWLGKLLLGTAFLLAALFLVTIEYRHFYSLNATERVTVWRWFKGQVYIIAGRYYGLLPPRSSYIESPERNDITLYFADALPSTLVVRTDRAKLLLHNSHMLALHILPYSGAEAYYHHLFYPPHAARHNELNPHVRFIEAHLYDIYATDNKGVRL